MDPSHFHKPWIEKLLSTFDPRQQQMSQNRPDSLVAQVLNIKQITDHIGGVEIGGKGELHDNHHYVNAVFTKEAVNRFEEDEGEEGWSGAEFGDIKNSIIALKKYHVVTPRVNNSQVFTDLLVCVEYFTLIHFDALPRISRDPLGFACNQRSVVANLNRLWQMKDEDLEPDLNPSEVTTDSHSSPHLTQLLDEINKASDEENRPTGKTFIFEIKIPIPASTSDSSSTNGSGENIRTLTRALDQMERKMAIVEGLKGLLGTMGGQVSVDSQDSQLFYDAPVLRVSELPKDYVDASQGQIENFNKSDFAVPLEVLKKLQTIEEWIPGYVKPSSLPSASTSVEIPDMLGGGLSISPVPSPAKNRPGVNASLCSTPARDRPGGSGKARPDGTAATRTEEHVTGNTITIESEEQRPGSKEGSQKSSSQSEAMSLGSDDWSMHSVDSIGLSAEELLLADSQVRAPTRPQQSTSPKKKSVTSAQEEKTENPKNNSHKIHSSSSSPVSAPVKRKRNLPSGESSPKILRQDSPSKTIKKRSNKVALVFESSKAISPIRPGGSQRGKRLHDRSHDRDETKRMTVEDDLILHSTPLVDGHKKENLEKKIPSESSIDFGRVATSSDRPAEDKANHSVQKGDLSKSSDEPGLDNKSNSDLFKNSEQVNSPEFVEVQVDDDDDDEDDSQESVVIIEAQSQEMTGQSRSNSSAEKQIKTVHFKESIQGCDNSEEENDEQDSGMTSSHPKETKKSRKLKTIGASDIAEVIDDSVEILNTSTGFEPAEFYTSPTSQRTHAVKRTRVLANLKSPQIVSSIATPINSLPSHQPRRSRSSVPSGSQSSMDSSNHTFEIANYQREVDPCIEELSNITIEDEVLQWCASYFANMEHDKKQKLQRGKKKRRDR